MLFRSLSFDFNCRETPPGLLREPGFILDSNGCKIDCVRTPPTTSTASRLRPDFYGSRAPSSTPTTGKPLSGLLREPDLSFDFNCRETPPRLLQEPGFILDSNGCKTDCVRTPPTTSTARRLRPDSYGSRAPSSTSTAGQTSSGLLREPDSAKNYNREQTSSGLLREPDSADDFNRE